MVVRMRHNRSQTAQHRSHHALKAGARTGCASCQAVIQPHRACSACGFYRGRAILKVKIKTATEKKKH